MTDIRCQNCGDTWDWDVSLEDVPEGEEIFAHEYNNPGEIGIYTSYYCSMQCLAEALEGSA